MNTIKSVYYGWGVLIVAGGGAYVFAKRSIDADRAVRAEADRKKKAMARDLEYSYSSQQQPASSSAGGHSNPSAEASSDPAPTRHAPETRGQEVTEKSKYEAAEPWKSRKGDRFS